MQTTELHYPKQISFDTLIPIFFLLKQEIEQRLHLHKEQETEKRLDLYKEQETEKILHLYKGQKINRAKTPWHHHKGPKIEQRLHFYKATVQNGNMSLTSGFLMLQGHRRTEIITNIHQTNEFYCN